MVAVAWVDDALTAYLKSRLRDDKNIVESIFRPDGPLGSFSARIKAAYLLGSITESLYSDLEIMRRIRNDFAHVRRNVRFKDQSIKDRCKLLTGAKAFQNGTGDAIRSPRQRFLLSAFFATECLLSCGKKPKRSKITLFDFYPVIIRRMGKSVSLEQLKIALAKFENGASR